MRFTNTLAVQSMLAALISVPAGAAKLGMGFKVGEVRQNSAIVWVRVTESDTRVSPGYREPSKRQPKEDQYVPSPIRLDQREGEMTGSPGFLRVHYSTNEDLSGGNATGWTAVKSTNDYIHQFEITGLIPSTQYYLRVESSPNAGAQVTGSLTGSFMTPANADSWQDVSFGVVTGQSYWDLDHADGYHIYPAMQKLRLNFLVPTGDTVYLDSEAPRARTIPLARFHWHRMYSLPRHIELHRYVPGYWEVDDHDSWCNDDWPTLNAPWMNPLTYQQAFAIYREQVPMGEKTYRTVRWGKGLQVWFVEGRTFRSPNTMPDGPAKTIWGKEQMAWLKESILQSDAHFRVLVSPTPIVGPDRTKGKNDNHANAAFAFEGEAFRMWTKQQGLQNFYSCCGDRHWQYMSIEPKSGLREFSCGPASNKHAGGNPNQPTWQPFLRVKGGFLSVSVFKDSGTPTIAFRHHNVNGRIVHEFTAESAE